MNSLLLFALISAAAVASVVSNKVSEVPKPKLNTVVEETELEKFEYDEFGVPLRTVPASRQNLNVGVVGPDDRLISRTTFGAAAASFIIHSPDLTIRGAEYTNITSVQVTRVGATQNAIPTITAGGLGRNFVTINFLGVRSRGFDYTVSVYASLGCPK